MRHFKHFLVFHYFIVLNVYILVADAYGSWPSEAVLEGNIYHLGSYSSCMEVNANDIFSGQYCFVTKKMTIIEEDNEKRINLGESADLLPSLVPLFPPFGALNVQVKY